MTTNNKTIRITKAQQFTAVKSLLKGEPATITTGTKDNMVTFQYTIDDALTFIDKEIASLARKNSNPSKKQTETQELNAEIKEEICEFLAGLDAESDGVTCTEIIKSKGWLEDYSVSKISSLLRQLKEDGKVNVKTVKGKSLFTLA